MKKLIKKFFGHKLARLIVAFGKHGKCSNLKHQQDVDNLKIMGL